MKEVQTTEKHSGPEIHWCPLLPVPERRMTYRDLRDFRDIVHRQEDLFDNACLYANFLWKNGLPARAILALCRALYLDPGKLPRETRQPWRAYVWFLENDTGSGFMGNPRVSFIHQANRIAEDFPLKRQRAWALWMLTRAYRPDFAPDPRVPEKPPVAESIRDYLDEHGLPGEGSAHYALIQEKSQ